MKQNVIHTKSYAFALRVVKLYKYLSTEKKEYVLSKQLLRSGTENYLEPCAARGWIEMTLPDKPQSKNQKYRLTPEGHEMQQKLRNGSK